MDEAGARASCRSAAGRSAYTLCGDTGSGMRFDPALAFDNYIRQLDDVFEQTGLERAALCGVSYGGFIALRYAAAAARARLVADPRLVAGAGLGADRAAAALRRAAVAVGARVRR